MIPQETLKIFVNTCSSRTSPKIQHDGGPSSWFCSCCLVSKSCLSLLQPKDCSPPISSIHGISQARILEWVAISFSRFNLPGPEIEPISPSLAGGFLPLSHQRDPKLILWGHNYHNTKARKKKKTLKTLKANTSD